jgi:molybdate transport system substrate-binding protein
MTRILLSLRIAFIAAAVFTSTLIVPAKDGAANAAELKVLASVALTSALNELAPAFERATGNKLAVRYGLAAELKKQLLEGETADVVILISPMMSDLERQNKLVAGSLANVGGTAVSVVSRAGTQKPDISSVDAFKRALLAAKSIVYADPAKGGASGVYFARVLDRIGLAEELKPKTILVPGAQAADFVAKGEAELGIAQASEILPVSGAQLVGPLPGELASVTAFTAGIGVGAKAPEGAKALIQFLTGPVALPLLKAKGFEPV